MRGAEKRYRGYVPERGTAAVARAALGLVGIDRMFHRSLSCRSSAHVGQLPVESEAYMPAADTQQHKDSHTCSLPLVELSQAVEAARHIVASTVAVGVRIRRQ